jgi:catechol 2,3-dioxygenase-like lactoylglutathione lyase family enzyme
MTNNERSPFTSWRADHSGLRVADREAAVAWYTKVLDFRVIEIIPLGPEMTFVFLAPPANDDFRVELVAGPGAEPRAVHTELGPTLGMSGWHHLCLRVTDVDETVAELKRRGVSILREPFDVQAIHSRIGFFADPWGNVFELMQA